MKRKIFLLLIVLLIMVIGTGFAASITLPVKMHNQLAIGSGLKGSFSITAEGERFNTPFLNQVKDAQFYVRGIQSGNDLHYYLFQKGEDELQTAVNELYRKDGVYYFRSDMVQGTILSFPTLNQYVEMLFPAESENISSSGFVSKLISLSQEEKEEKWNPVLNRYQKELELWLSQFAVQAESVKLESGLSALDFSYDIPMSRVNEQIISLFGEFASDAELTALLNNVMTDQEKELYLNGNLLYYYQEALNSLNINRSVRMSKRVSAVGELLRFKLELPFDERITGYESLSLEMVDHLTIYTLTSSDKVILLALPDTESFKQSSFSLSLWFACIHTGQKEDGKTDSIAYRADIQKKNETYKDDNDKTHETDHYHIIIEQDTKYLPEDTDISGLKKAEPIKMDADLHFSSNYAQNSPTVLEIKINVSEGDSFLRLDGTVKSAPPWLFMPFEIIDPVQTGTDKAEVLEPYMTDWISNAASIIRHNAAEETETTSAVDQTGVETDTQSQTETAPLNQTGLE